MLINSGECIKCGDVTTNVADGRQRPFCHACEQMFNEKIAAGKIGKKFQAGRLIFPKAEEED